MGSAEQAEAEVYYRHVRNAKILLKLGVYCGLVALVFALGATISGDESIRVWAAFPIMAGALLGGSAFAQWATRHG